MIVLVFVYIVFDNCMYINLIICRNNWLNFFLRWKKLKIIVNNFYYVLKCVILFIY